MTPLLLHILRQYFDKKQSEVVSKSKSRLSKVKVCCVLVESVFNCCPELWEFVGGVDKSGRITRDKKAVLKSILENIIYCVQHNSSYYKELMKRFGYDNHGLHFRINPKNSAIVMTTKGKAPIIVERQFLLSFCGDIFDIYWQVIEKQLRLSGKLLQIMQCEIN